MRQLVGTLLVLTLSFATACSRHFVIERVAGAADGVEREKSIASGSDERWSVLREPASGEGEER